MQKYDFCVIGLGAFGISTLYHLSRTGASTIGVDLNNPPHRLGSSHGESRITRLAIAEHPVLSKFAKRSHTIWSAIERQTKTQVLFQNGMLIISSPTVTAKNHVTNLFKKTVDAAEANQINYELLSSSSLKENFPQFKTAKNAIGFFEPTAGYLLVEQCLQSQKQLALEQGAIIKTGYKVKNLEETSEGVQVNFENSSILAKRVVLATGQWTSELLPGKLKPLFQSFRQVLYWFKVAKDKQSYQAKNFPVFIWEFEGHLQASYGFPIIENNGSSIKLATEDFDTPSNPYQFLRTATVREISNFYNSYVKDRLDGVSDICTNSKTCSYTMTKDQNFIIDFLPNSKKVMLISACNGHGFKHSPAIGEAVSEILLKGSSTLPLSDFSLSRFN